MKKEVFAIFGLFFVIIALGVMVIMGLLVPEADPGIEIRLSKTGGRGVFATKHFRPGDIVEACPTLYAPNGQWGQSTKDYVFQVSLEKQMLALGSCSMYNHGDFPNTTHKLSDDWSTLYIIACKRIMPGQEIFIHYGDSWWKSRKSYEKK